jgi:hypothetical protein
MAELVIVSMTVNCYEIDLDLDARSMDRSIRRGTRAMDALNSGKLVRRERSYYFVGTFRREVIYSVVADDMEDAVRKFHSSAQAAIEISFVIKTETEIYLAQGK